MRRIIIADSSDSFSEQLCDLLSAKYHVTCITNGQHALRHIMHEAADLLIMDIELAELDGISLLRQLRSAGIRIPVIAMGRFLSEYAVDALVQLKADYVLRRPCKPIRVAEHAKEILRLREPEGSPVRRKIQDILDMFGIPAHLRGTAYLLCAVTFMAADPTQYITKELYPSVGKVFGVNGQLVERSIRNAVQKGYEQGEQSLWERYFGRSTNGGGNKPQNTEFILAVAQLLKEEI